MLPLLDVLPRQNLTDASNSRRVRLTAAIVFINEDFHVFRNRCLFLSICSPEFRKIPANLYIEASYSMILDFATLMGQESSA